MIIRKSITIIILTRLALIVASLFLWFYLGANVSGYMGRRCEATGFLIGSMTVINLMYHLVTYRFKYLSFTQDGVEDKMSILFPDKYPWIKIKEFEIVGNHKIIISTGVARKEFSELAISDKEKSIIQKKYRLHRLNKKK